MPTKPGTINGGLMKRTMPEQVFTNYISVPSVEASLKTLTENGGIMLMPKTEIGKEMGWIALFKDTEGNVMGLHELPEKMK